MIKKIPVKEELINLINQGKTNVQISKIYKVDPSTISRWKNKLEITKEVLNNSLSIKDKIKNILFENILDINIFAKENKIEKNEIYEILEKLEKQGHIIEKSASGYFINKNVIAQDKIYNYFGKKLKFGTVGDTHLCSKEQQITHLNTFYDICEKEGITEIYHTGDIVAGDGVYRGQRFETFYQSLDDQANYVIDHYPNRKKIKTHFITGNHDYSYFKQVGADIGKMIAREREDMIYLGRLGAYVELRENIKMHLLHPDGGGSYAKSYKPQKLIENYSSENKPNILLLGHFHTSMYFFTRNVHAFVTGCFEAQTPFLQRKGLHPEIGGWIVEIIPANDGSILRIKCEWIPFYKPVYRDY